VQAQAGLGDRYRTRGSAGTSPWLVLGIAVLAASLVAVGAVVVLDSLNLWRPNAARLPEPTPTPSRPTPGAFAVGRQEPGAEGGATPTTPGTGSPDTGPGPSLIPPSSSGGPLFNPNVPSMQPSGAAAPSGGESGASASPGANQPSPDTASGSSPGAGASPAAPDSPLERAVANARGRLVTDEDLVGQLLLLGWIGSTAEEARPALRDLRAGGIVFVQNVATSAEARAVNQALQRISGEVNLLPPLTAIDHEGGIVQRIKDVRNLGPNWDLGARGASDAEACQRGLAHAQALRDMGFTMNLAPVLDVNNNPANPVIGTRSYSDDPDVVARLGTAYIRGLQGGGVAAVGKHFPGHGNTSVDSHLGLPSLPQSVDALEQVELVPFRRAIEGGVAGIMSAHIVFPAVDPSGVPATLSRKVMTGLLRDQLRFGGLAVSDDMGAMKAITDNYTPGQAAVKAVQAGVDMLILASELPRQREARDALLAAVGSGEIPRARLDEAVHNVLVVKARYGLLGPGVQAVQPGGGC
jgi:beta-N-acetylhexosaminidase